MAEALIKVSDINGEVQLEVKFHPAVDNHSPAHRLVQQFVLFANMERVDDATGGEQHTGD